MKNSAMSSCPPNFSSISFFLAKPSILLATPNLNTQIHKLFSYKPSSRLSPILTQPISHFPNISCSHPPHSQRPDPKSPPTLLRSCADVAAALLVGSVLFIGRFSITPSSALADAPKTSPSAPLEERVDAQNGKDDWEGMYAKILEDNPKDVEALKVVLYGLIKKGKMVETLDCVARLIELEPDEVEWRLLRALFYEIAGRLPEAKRLFEEILKERPLLLRALHGLALTMHKNKEGPAVFEMLNKALELARREERVTEERNIQILIAQMHVVKGDLQEALRKFQDLVNENHRDFRPYLCQGIIYSLLGKKKEAEEQFEIYRSLIPDEFPQRGFIDDVILSAKTKSQEQLEKEFKSEYRNKK